MISMGAALIGGSLQRGVSAGGGRFATDPGDGGLEGARGEQGAGGLGDEPARETAGRADGHGGADLAPGRGGLELVRDVEADRAAGAQGEPALVGLGDLDVEADAAA